MKTAGEMLRAASRCSEYLSEADMDCIAGYLLGQMNPDGGFRGRTPASDLYYTLFGIESLLALKRPPPAVRLAGYLGTFGDGKGLDFVHLVCLARCLARLDAEALDLAGGAIFRALEAHRSSDGGYGLTPGAEGGSAYASFLALLAYEDAGRGPPGADGLLGSVRSLGTPDGAYANEPGLARGTTTATAAAALLLARLGAPADCAAADWLLGQCCRKRGGFLSTPAAPAPDLLSTASALHALRSLGRRLEDVREVCLDFIEGLWDESGGFRGHEADPVPDCEYTFYALLALGSLAA